LQLVQNALTHSGHLHTVGTYTQGSSKAWKGTEYKKTHGTVGFC